MLPFLFCLRRQRQKSRAAKKSIPKTIPGMNPATKDFGEKPSESPAFSFGPLVEEAASAGLVLDAVSETEEEVVVGDVVVVLPVDESAAASLSVIATHNVPEHR